MASERGSAGDIGRAERHHDQHPDHHRQAEKGPGADQRERVGAIFRIAVEVGEGAPTGKQQCGAARDIEHAERRYERRHIEPGYQYAVDPADGYPCQADNCRDLEGVEIERPAHPHIDAVEHQPAGDHAGQPDHRTDRQVDAAGDDDEGHADGQEGVDRHMFGNENGVGCAQKIRRHDRKEGQHQQQRHEGAGLEQQQEPVCVGAGFRRGAVTRRRHDTMSLFLLFALAGEAAAITSAALAPLPNSPLIRPLAITIIRSESARTSSRSEVTNMIPMPSAASARILW